MQTKALAIAMRTFFVNVDNREQEAYSILAECDEPYTTYIDAYCDNHFFQPWQPFELRSVDDMMNIVDDLTLDIVSTFTDEPEQDNPDSFHDAILQADVDNNVTLCPHCQSTNYIKKGKDNNKQRYKCKDCGTHFYG